MERFHLIFSKGLWLGTFSHFEKQSLRHAVSTRVGGSSKFPFASLNLALHTGDEPDAVRENRLCFARAVGAPAQWLTTAEQVHGDMVFVVRQEHAGLGAAEYSQAIAGADALVTNVPDIPLLLFFADCVPVLIADPVKRAIAVSHAGWKGTVAAIAAKTIQAMVREYGTNPADCLAAIGPSIGPCCYEVSDNVIEKMQDFSYWRDLITDHGASRHLDLWEANRRQLLAAGLAEENIVVSKVCTACNTELYFSYRAENGSTGRIGALIAL